jgi:hypothetical protein
MGLRMAAKTQITKLGIPLNFFLALCIGLFMANRSVGNFQALPDELVSVLALTLLLQEIILIQYLCWNANVAYQDRILQGNVTRVRRLQLLIVPIILIMVIGIIGLILSNHDLDQSAIIRVVCISVIITLGLDPLFGLTDRDYFAIFGAGVVYLLVISTAIQRIDTLAIGLSSYVGELVSISVTYMVLAYLILSIRWTYYRLFCFNQMEEPLHVVADSFVPFAFIIYPSLPQLWISIVWLFSGK